jgi:predicted metal-dependent peptidase
MKNKPTAQERVDQRITNMVLNHPFFSTCILNLAVRPEPVGTACTDGTVLLWDPAFIDGIEEDAEVTGLLAHEVMHCVLLHPFRMDKTYHDPKLSNIAMDYEINNYLDVYNKEYVQKHPSRGAPFPLPQGALIDHQYDGLAWEQIYEKLLKEGKGKGKGKGPGGQPGNQPGGQGQGPPQPGQNPASDGTWGRVEAPGQGACKPKDGDGKQRDGNGNPVETKTMGDWQGGIVPKAEAVARMQGNMPGAFASMLDKLRRPEIPWTEYLARYFDQHAQDDYDLRRPDRRHTPADIYLPTLHSESMGEIVIAIDTSGSIYCDPELFERFMGEVDDVLGRVKPSKTTLLQCDTCITEVIEYHPGDRVAPDFKLNGGGGTDFRPVFDWIDENNVSPRVLVFFTDGLGTFPRSAPGYDVLWVDYEGTSYPFGDVIRTKPQ